MYIGIDLGNKNSYIAVMDKRGNIVKEDKITNSAIEFNKLAREYPNSTVAIEATRNYMWVYDALERNGLVVKLINPLKTKAIAEARIKNDKLDARMIAHLLRSNLIAESYVPNKAIRELRDLIRYRMKLVNQRAQVKNRIHSILAKHGMMHEFSDLFGKAGISYLRDLLLPTMDRKMMDSNLRIINFLSREIDKLDSEVRELCEQDEEAKLLTSMPGVGYYSALLIKSEIADVNRFSDDTKLVSYAGLNPSIRQSGSTVHRGRITKQGSKLIRWVLTNCANVAIRKDKYLKRFYERIKTRKGHKIAIVATARKMLVCIYHMLKKKEKYKPK
jgi:transposase